MTDFLRDLRLGFRLLLRAPGFATTAILTLALGIGATTALFTVVNAGLLEPLPFPDSTTLGQGRRRRGCGGTRALSAVVKAVLLEPLPFPDSNKLVQVWRSELPALTYGSA